MEYGPGCILRQAREQRGSASSSNGRGSHDPAAPHLFAVVLYLPVLSFAFSYTGTVYILSQTDHTRSAPSSIANVQPLRCIIRVKWRSMYLNSNCFCRVIGCCTDRVSHQIYRHVSSHRMQGTLQRARRDFGRRLDTMQSSVTRVRLAGVAQHARLPRRTPLATGACRAVNVGEEVHVYGFNEKVMPPGLLKSPQIHALVHVCRGQIHPRWACMPELCTHL